MSEQPVAVPPSEAPKPPLGMTPRMVEYLDKLRMASKPSITGWPKLLMNRFRFLSEEKAKEVVNYWIKTHKP